VNTVERISWIINQEFDIAREITPETTFEDLGLDSLEFAALMLAIGRDLGEIPEERWPDLRAIGDILELVS